jgi:hypothetical protein
LAVARDFDQIARHLIRETSTFNSTKVVECHFSLDFNKGQTRDRG